MDYKDYYKIIGVSRDADAKAIRSAFRHLARQYHPDVNPGDTKVDEHLKEINEVTSCRTRKSAYPPSQSVKC